MDLTEEQRRELPKVWHRLEDDNAYVELAITRMLDVDVAVHFFPQSDGLIRVTLLAHDRVAVETTKVEAAELHLFQGLLGAIAALVEPEVILVKKS